jgi:hypothetical protein
MRSPSIVGGSDDALSVRYCQLRLNGRARGEVETARGSLESLRPGLAVCHPSADVAVIARMIMKYAIDLIYDVKPGRGHVQKRFYCALWLAVKVQGKRDRIKGFLSRVIRFSVSK